jgi:hypothetical protein
VNETDFQLNALRDVMALPGMRQLQEHRVLRAHTDGTHTATFELFRGETAVHYSYLTDPMRFFSRAILPYGSQIAIGGDKGGECSKIGVTFFRGGQLAFAPLVCFTGDDDYDALHVLAQSRTRFVFTGDSEQFSSYTAVLQHLIDTRGAKLNGDWVWLNTVLGLSTPGATFGCCICVSPVRELTTGALRTAEQLQNDMLAASGNPSPDKNHSVMRWPLLSVHATSIVPLPLHIFLGLGNLFINDVYRKLAGDVEINPVIARARAVRAAGYAYGGAQRVFDLTGPELHRWIHKGLASRLKCGHLRVRLLIRGATQYTCELPGVSARQRIAVMERWLAALCRFLLKSDRFSDREIVEFRTLQREIWQRWREITGRAHTPKVHMLAHAVAFAAMHRRLGFFAESQIESSHAQFNRAYDDTHRNVSHIPAERLRRSHVALILPFLAVEQQ